jgi:arylsulfatase A-like enzyme
MDSAAAGFQHSRAPVPGFKAQILRAMLTLLLISPAALPAAAAPRPNILYILADDMGYADPVFMGPGKKELHTPYLDKIAKGGTILSSFYVQPLCSPTRSTIMTGRHVAHNGVYTVVRPNAPWGLPLAERTLPQALREAGYETAIVGKWHLGEFQPAYRPTQRGFDHQYGLWFGAIDYYTHKRDGVLDWHRNDQPCQDEGYATHLIAKEACRIIRERNPAKPLFLYLPFNAVHAPHQVPEKYTQPFTNLTGLRKTYAGMVAAMDEAVGQVIAALDEAKMRDNTLIIFHSDNGGPSPGRVTDNGPLRAGKGTIYEGGIRVCAAVNWPGHVPAGKTVAEPLHSIDWYPTLLKLAGASAEQKLPVDGLDIWPVIAAGAKSPHASLLLCGMRPQTRAVRMGDWKLLVGASERDAYNADGDPDAAGSVELYHLADDLGERRNLAAANPVKVKELRAELDRLMRDAVPPGNVESAPPAKKSGKKARK